MKKGNILILKMKNKINDLIKYKNYILNRDKRKKIFVAKAHFYKLKQVVEGGNLESFLWGNLMSGLNSIIQNYTSKA